MSLRDEGFKRRDASSYDGVVDSFEQFTERFTSPLARRLVELGELTPGSRALDIGTGTGVVALAAAETVGSGGRVVGIDLSEGMLKTANEKARAAGLDRRLEFRREDAEALGFADASFDAVLSLYALLHFPDPRAAAGEMYRVLRPGGRLALAIGSAPPRLSLEGLAYVWRRLPFLYHRLRGDWLAAPAFLDSLVGRHLPAGEEHEQTVLSRATSTPSALVPRIFREAGFRNLSTSWDACLGTLATVEEFWELQATFSSFARKRIELARGDRLKELRREFDATCSRVLAGGGRLVYPYAAYYVTGRRPAS